MTDENNIIDVDGKTSSIEIGDVPFWNVEFTGEFPFDMRTMEAIHQFVLQRMNEDYKVAVEAMEKVRIKYESEMRSKGESQDESNRT